MTDPNNQTWTYSYDAAGNLTSGTDPLGNKTTYGYNAIGWKTSATSPKGNVAGANPAQFTAAFDHNPFGDVTTITDPLGHQTIRHYDANRNLDQVTDGDGNVTKYTYDSANELTITTRADSTTLQTDYNPDGTVFHQYDGKHNATTYGYDSLARVTSVSDPLNRTTRYTYDGAGNRLTMTDPQSPPQTTTYSYDAANELTAISYSDGKTPNVTNIKYDADGQRTAMTDGTGTSSWAYDSLNRLTSSTDGAGATVGYGYDLKGQLTGITYPGNRVVTRVYDAAGRLHQVTDWLGHSTTFDYDPNANLTTETFPSSTAFQDTFAFDAADRLMGITYFQAGSILASWTYGRDGADQLTSVVPNGPVHEKRQSYAYNALNQLVIDNRSLYAYDAADNITALITGDTLSYDAANQITTLAHGAQTTTFGFDPRGNRVTVTPYKGPAVTSSYDQANRLIAFGSSATYAYNGDGLRMRKTVAGTAEPFVWNVAQGLPLVLMDGGTSYVYGPGGLPLEQISASGAVLYYHHDQLGSTRMLTDAAGNVAATFTYDPYGNVTNQKGTVTNPFFGYAGQYTDSESGLYYLRERYYDPSAGQFLTRDRAVAATRSPYAYVAGNPLNATDPSGLCAPICIVIVVGVVIAGMIAVSAAHPECGGEDAPCILYPHTTPPPPSFQGPPTDDTKPGGTVACRADQCWVKNSNTCSGWTQQPPPQVPTSGPGPGDPNYGTWFFTSPTADSATPTPAPTPSSQVYGPPAPGSSSP